MNRLSDQIKGYQVIGEIAEGGMGKVLKVVNTSLNRIEALKLPSTGKKISQEQIIRLRREVNALIQLKQKAPHLSIPEVFYFENKRDLPFYTMQYIEGQTLEEIIRQKRIDTLVATQIMEELAYILEVMHSQGILHRDIKASNVIIDPFGRPWLVDFGIIRELDDEKTRITEEGVVIGTPANMAPEQITREETTTLSDIYALGTIFYRMLTGRPVITSKRIYSALFEIVHKEPPSPLELDKDLDPMLNNIVLKMLAKDPQQRYQGAVAVRNILVQYLVAYQQQEKAKTISVAQKKSNNKKSQQRTIRTRKLKTLVYRIFRKYRRNRIPNVPCLGMQKLHSHIAFDNIKPTIM